MSNTDGDCARLEAACGINLAWWKDSCASGVIGRGLFIEHFAKHANDKNAARRRASTRAAAAMAPAPKGE